jgi:NAD(P)-dependent dehydrogenase (short-subunit alcohol dehydrogenase family)
MAVKGRVALVSGASSGLGRAIANDLQDAGYRVYGTSRKVTGKDNPYGDFELIAMDVDRDASVKAAIGALTRPRKVGFSTRRQAICWRRRFLGRFKSSKIGRTMSHAETLIDLEARIAAIRENIRELTEQAAAYSGATDEARTADRIAEQESRLAELLKEREALSG